MFFWNKIDRFQYELSIMFWIHKAFRTTVTRFEEIVILELTETKWKSLAFTKLLVGTQQFLISGSRCIIWTCFYQLCIAIGNIYPNWNQKKTQRFVTEFCFPYCSWFCSIYNQKIYIKGFPLRNQNNFDFQIFGRTYYFLRKVLLVRFSGVMA